jgi:hypothetical protein
MTHLLLRQRLRRESPSSDSCSVSFLANIMATANAIGKINRRDPRLTGANFPTCERLALAHKQPFVPDVH